MTTFFSVFRKMGPHWLLSEEDGERIGFSVASLVAATAERVRLGLRARFPELAPADALPAIGRDREIVRGFAESNASYAARLVRAIDDKRTVGNPYALMAQLRGYLGVDLMIRTVDMRGNWYTVDDDGTKSVALNEGNWDWEGDAATQWSQFWVILYPPASLWTAGPDIGDADLWDDAIGSDGFTIGSTATPDQVRSVRRIVNTWKPAGTRCRYIIVAFDPASFDPSTPAGPPLPDGTWGRAGVGDPRVKARLSTARYWHGGP